MVRGCVVVLLSLLSGCVVAVTVDTTFDEPVDRIEVDLDQGNVSIEAAPGPVQLSADLGGVGDGTFDWEVVDRVLYITATCGELCGGDVELTAPRDTDFVARLGLGDVEVVRLGGDVDVSMTAGSLCGMDLASAEVVASSAAGDIDVQWSERPIDVTAGTEAGSVALAVPAGRYVLALDAGRGRVSTEGVQHDPEADAAIRAWTDAGSVEVVGR